MESIEINGETYYKNQIEPIRTKITQSAIGKWAIIRSRNEGINFGLVAEADETGIVLKDARRLWRPISPVGQPSWYEGVAKVGLQDNGKISTVVDTKIILEDYSITLCSQQAIDNIRNYPENKTTYEN